MKKNKYKPQEEDKNRKVELYPAIRITINGNKYGYIDKYGKEIIPFKFTNAYNFNEYGLAIVNENGRYGIINSEGIYIVNAQYSLINQYSEGRSIYVENTAMGVFDEKGHKLTDAVYDYIGNYKDGYAVIRKTYGNKYRYGYLNLKGGESCETKYIEANDFNGNYALVKIKDREYSLIDNQCNIVNTYKYEYVGSYGNDMMVFSILLGGPYGYISKEDRIVINPIYSYAREFIDGISIVSTSSEIDKYGVIDKLGRPIYGEIYSDIKYLGEGRLALGLPIGKTKAKSRIIYAIGDDKGTIFTKFKFFKVNNFSNGMASVSDSRKTFFINKDGKELNNLPIFLGSGKLDLLGDIVQAYVDYYIYYLAQNNKMIYGPNKTINLSETYSIIIEKYRPNINYLIYIPNIYGMNDKNAENQINLELRRLSIFDPPSDDIYVQTQLIITDEEILPYNYYGNFKILFYKENLLVLDLVGYYSEINQESILQVRKTCSINLLTGKLYKIKDLFNEGSNWDIEINNNILKIIKEEPNYNFIFPDSFKGITENQDFYIDNDNLYIYYHPEKIAPESMGFITFTIPLKNIDKIINKEGELYKLLTG